MKTIIATFIALTIATPALAYKELVKPVCPVVNESKPKPVVPLKKNDLGNKIVKTQEPG